ncbi:homoserine O-acetyltransferase MetX [Demequina sp. SO4-18]|uniref:homoserine O-acetyltransferase MetX n=1 Tax=Demequina sp. SO4-18 TaxID=3401026 RepID=UPI003B5CFFF5
MTETGASVAPGSINRGEKPRATAAWRPGDPVGHRRFLEIEALPLEADPLGSIDVSLAYETWGELNEAKDNAVYVAHAFTGDSHVMGDAEPGHPSPGWWPGIVGPGKAIDPDRHFIVCANVVGGCQGTTGPAHPHPEDGKPWGSRFPWVTVRDMVAAEVRLADALGIDRWRMVLGPSLGGLRALEWAASYPERVQSIGVIGATAATTADQIAWGSAQAQAIRLDPDFNDGDYYDTERGPHRGLALAREIAHTTYRTSAELEARFGRDVQHGDPLTPDGQFAVQSYLAHHGNKLVDRFDANSYLRMIHAVDTHDVGRERGGAKQALSHFEGQALVVAVDSDRLYTVEDAHLTAAALPRNPEATVLHATSGHDSFLANWPALDDEVRRAEHILV